jgi:hypothetical protein
LAVYFKLLLILVYGIADLSRNGMKKIIIEAKKMITAKAIISAASLGMFLPFIKLVYWVFDTAYLSGFGINPEIYSRPIFSSSFIGVWLFAESLYPMMIGWIFFSLIIFLVLFNMNLSLLGRPLRAEQGIDILESDTKWIRFKKIFPTAFSKSVNWPIAILLIGIYLIIFITGAASYSSKKGRSLAEIQMEHYNANGECWDKFNSKNNGCFRVSGISGAGHFVIANLETHLLYLSREVVNGNGAGESNKKFITKLHIHEKSPKEKYSISRDYKPTKAKTED